MSLSAPASKKIAFLFALSTTIVAGAATARAEDSPSYLETAKKKASELVSSVPDISLPDLPSLSLPELPSMSVPDVSGIKDAVLRQFSVFTDDIGASLPALEAMGYEVTSFRVHWSLKPKAKLRLKSTTLADPAKVAAAMASATNRGIVAGAILTSAAQAKRIQRALHMGTAIIDVDFDLPPKVRMSFLPGKSSDVKDVGELEVVCPTADER